jgi:hypothetical protein
MSDDSGDHVGQLMDQITQMQETIMNLNEKISKVKREVLEEQVKNGMAEETIKKMGLDIVDLRQAAGPTADLIAKLKEDIDKAKKGEDLLRRDLHQSRIQIKRLMGENIPEGQDEIFTLNKEVQCTLIGNSDDNNYTATNMNPKLPEDSQQSKQQKQAQQEEVQRNKQEEKHFLHGPSNEELQEMELQKKEANMNNEEKIQSMTTRIELLKKQADNVKKEYAELQNVAAEKEKRLTEQKSTILKQQQMLEKMLDAPEGQRIKVDESMTGHIYGGQTRSLQHTQHVESRGPSAASSNNIHGGAAGVGSKSEFNEKKTTKQRKNDDSKRHEHAGYTGGHEGGLDGDDAKENMVKSSKGGKDSFPRGGDRAGNHITEVGEYVSEVQSPIEDPNISPESAANKRICLNAWRFHEQVVRHIIGSGESNMDKEYVDSTLRARSITVQDSIKFQGTIFQALANYLSAKWNEGVESMAAMLRQGDDLNQQTTSETIQHMIQKKKLLHTKRLLEDSKRFDLTANLETRIKQAAERWERRKTEIKEERARVLLACMESFLKVVTVNFKIQIAPGIMQDIKGHMYTSLVDGSRRRQSMLLGRGLDSRPGTRIPTPRTLASLCVCVCFCVLECTRIMCCVYVRMRARVGMFAFDCKYPCVILRFCSSNATVSTSHRRRWWRCSFFVIYWFGGCFP